MTPHNIGISTNILHNPEHMTDCLKCLSEITNHIEIEFEKNAKKVLAYSVKELELWIKNIIQIKQERNLSFSVHAPYAGLNTDLASDHEQTRLKAIDLMAKCLYITKKIGADLFTFHPGYLPRNGQQYNYFNNLLRSLEELAGYAQDFNITLSLENTGTDRPKYIVLSNEQYNILNTEFGIKMTMDIIHYTSFNAEVNTQYYEQLSKLIPYINNIHFADMHDNNHRHLPLGKGNFPYHKVLQFIYEHGYNGYAIIEETGGNYAAEDYLFSAKEYIKNVSRN